MHRWMIRSNPTFSPVIYCGAKYADAHSGKGMIPEWVPIFGVCLNSLNQHSTNYASFAHSAKTPNLTTSFAPRYENR